MSGAKELIKLSFSVAVIAVLCPSFASAATYHVDSTNGSDDLDGLTPDTAWKSLSKINATSFAPGDYILLHRDQTWRERIIVSSSGSADHPITYGAYGDGKPPTIDGSASAVPDHSGLIVIMQKAQIVLENLEVKNSIRNGIVPYLARAITIRNCLIHDSRQNGMMTYDSQDVTISTSEFYNNSQDTATSYSGIRLDGSGGTLSQFVISDCRIHDNVGGADWNSGNGIYLGHTGSSIPTLSAVAITGNEIYSNGNRNQNQAGRGLSGSFQGDISATGNYIHDNASAGLYVGDEGLHIDATICNNTFKNNALRQFGGFTDGTANACSNTLIVDDPNITGMGVEVGGAGVWTLNSNVFYFYGSTSDVYRGFIRINDATQDVALQSDYNLFYSGGPNRWKRSDGIVLTFSQWRAAGYDKHSVNPK